MSDAAVKTAEVEVLTAEVRVLMVGSRQITLSVARQLDRVHLLDVEPFGRVRLNQGTDYYSPNVIGKDRETGVLVVASYETNPSVRPGLIPASPLTVCEHWDHPPVYHLELSGRPFAVARDFTIRCSIHASANAPRLPTYPVDGSPEEHAAYHRRTQEWHEQRKVWEATQCEHWNAKASTKADLRDQLDRHDRYRASCAAALLLPLIVLAGLR
jgi:hypothetical protein